MSTTLSARYFNYAVYSSIMNGDVIYDLGPDCQVKLHAEILILPPDELKQKNKKHWDTKKEKRWS